MRILGIDPGLRITGYGVLDLKTAAIEPTLVEAGIIRLDVKKSLEERLRQLYTELQTLIARVKPDEMAVEKLYAHYKHPRTSILMGHARGVILLCASLHEIPVTHLPANEVKKSVTGYGHASKEQVQRAVQSQLGLADLPRPPDVADALAIALTHARRLVQGRLSFPSA